MLDFDLNNEEQLLELKSDMFASLLHFTRVFFELRTGRPFIIDNPHSRESPQITICKALTRAFKLLSKRLVINIEPGSGKSELLKHFVAWAMAQYPDSNFIYVSYSHDLASKHTYGIKEIMSMPIYKKLFDINIKHDSSAKDHFTTEQGGCVYAAGSQGTITGFNAGLPVSDRFSGCLLMDDMHNPIEVRSDTIRERVKENYLGTLSQRPRSPVVPQIFIGQRLDEDDLPANFLNEYDGHRWESVILPSLDEHNNVLIPRIRSLEDLLIAKEKKPYVFAAQNQQNPLPAGGGIFKTDYFKTLDEEPDIIATFITADTAETDKTYNDPTVFSFWGLYKIKQREIQTDILALHWLDCRQVWIEPKDLENELMDFYTMSMRHKIKPRNIAIEKKSTGTTLCSVLQRVQGLRIIDIERTKASGNKATRYLETQEYAASHLITLPKYGKHNDMVINHMKKITANNSHAHDDICFVAGTKIATLFGYKDIENITTKDLVITPFGLGKIKACGMSKINAKVIKYKDLIGTPNHPIFEVNKFSPLDTLSDVSKPDILSFGGILKWRYKKLLCSMELNMNYLGREGIILVNQKAILEERNLKDFMLRFGNFIAKKQFLKAMLFTTKMAIILTTITATWNAFLLNNILRFILGKASQLHKNPWNILLKLGSKQKHGIEATKAENGIVKMLKIASTKLKNIFVLSAKKNLRPNYQQNTVAMTVLKSTMQEKHESEDLQDVYNLTVETYGVYYANDMLVSNCDTYYDAVKLGLIDKVISGIDYDLEQKNKKEATARLLMGTFNKLKSINSVSNWV